MNTTDQIIEMIRQLIKQTREFEILGVGEDVCRDRWDKIREALDELGGVR